MKNAVLFNFNVDKEAKQIHVERYFDAPLNLVWSAWTEADLLDLWWAPKPYQACTQSMDFREGGRWHYYMLSPEGEKHYCLFDYEKIIPQQLYAGRDHFCDENENINTAHPSMYWENSFTTSEAGAVVNCKIQFESLNDLETIIQMGFKEGFTMGMENLDGYIKAQFYLRKQKGAPVTPRVSSYLNFDGKTEEAFHFYKEVFQSEFIGGIQRFGDLPEDPNGPPASEALKKMIIHVQLPILGGHILMGTDAPKEMGFTVKPGNNMHIQLEPTTRKETERIFNLLAEGGEIEHTLQDMFWGAYFASFQDKYGINWFLNCLEEK